MLILKDSSACALLLSGPGNAEGGLVQSCAGWNVERRRNHIDLVYAFIYTYGLQRQLPYPRWGYQGIWRVRSVSPVHWYNEVRTQATESSSSFHKQWRICQVHNVTKPMDRTKLLIAMAYDDDHSGNEAPTVICGNAMWCHVIQSVLPRLRCSK